MRRLRELLRLKYDAGLMADTSHATAPVTDLRPAPRGVLPRGMEMWLLLGLAFGILAIVLCAGRPEPADRLGATAAPKPIALNAGRLRDYQDRLHVLDDRARQEPVTHPLLARPQSVGADSPPTKAAPDALEAEQRRREYESLFASNVVMSRRPKAQQLMSPGSAVSRAGGGRWPAPTAKP